MPRVSDYELEHLEDEQFEIRKPKKTKQTKEKKYSEKKDYRSDWRKLQSVKEIVKESEDEESEEF